MLLSFVKDRILKPFTDLPASLISNNLIEAPFTVVNIERVETKGGVPFKNKEFELKNM